MTSTSPLARLRLLLGLCVAMAVPCPATAGVTVDRTRIIFPAGSQEISLELVNANAYPVFVQAWVDDGAIDSSPDTAQAPVMPLPPFFRLDTGERRGLRLLYTGEPLPTDRESLYWLNLYEIPPTPDPDEAMENAAVLVVTMRTQTKLLHRPDGLQPRSSEAFSRLEFSITGSGQQETLRIRNDGPYFVTLTSIELLDGSRRPCNRDVSTMVAPFSDQAVPMEAIDSAKAGCEKRSVRFNWIDDNGDAREETTTLR